MTESEQEELARLRRERRDIIVSHWAQTECAIRNVMALMMPGVVDEQVEEYLEVDEFGLALELVAAIVMKRD